MIILQYNRRSRFSHSRKWRFEVWSPPALGDSAGIYAELPGGVVLRPASRLRGSIGVRVFGLELIFILGDPWSEQEIVAHNEAVMNSVVLSRLYKPGARPDA